MNLEPAKLEIKSATRVTGGPATPRKGPPKFKQRQTRQFKSKPPKKGVQGLGVPRMPSYLRSSAYYYTKSPPMSTFTTSPPPSPHITGHYHGPYRFGDDIPGMEGLGTDITVICPWEAFNHLELHELAQYGII